MRRMGACTDIDDDIAADAHVHITDFEVGG
jgi:hypothetical protein